MRINFTPTQQEETINKCQSIKMFDEIDFEKSEKVIKKESIKKAQMSIR